ncbi:uncharacterized protein [Mytilus edulis]|uniref:uncharacterized protein n=1 Tax=Mytilus edulis TaxID=6550 RepID=UPI0039EEDC27
MAILRLVQNEAYNDCMCVLRKSTTLPQTEQLLPLNPFLCDGILRVGGRLRKSDQSFSAKHPVILPKDSFITRLILSHVHRIVQHQGRGITHNELRSRGYWIIGGSKTVANFIRQCVICRKLRRPTEVQKMADLPGDRLQSSAPFTYCGMDCIGPFIVRQGRKEIKRYGLLITCMCSRAIHI